MTTSPLKSLYLRYQPAITDRLHVTLSTTCEIGISQASDFTFAKATEAILMCAECSWPSKRKSKDRNGS